MSRKLFSLVVVGLMVACGGGEAGEGAAADSAAAPGGLEGMAGAAGRAEATLRIAEMRSHLNVLTAAGGDEQVGMVPQHSQMTATLLTELSANPPTNPGWAPLADSVRQDLARMQNMPAVELDALVEQHADRLQRLMQMYEAPR